MSTKDPLLRVSELSVVLDGTTIFENLSFELNPGETLVILGPNGAGKTVLLKALLGILPFHGTIQWKTDSTRSYVPQRVPLNRDIPMTVEDFFALKSITKLHASQVLQSVGISDVQFMDRQLGVLSTGQFQRVLIAWAMAKIPDVILLDEPMAGVDIGGEDIIHAFLHGTQTAKRETAAILVTHDLSMVYGEATRVLCLNRTLSFVGSAIEVLDPKRLQEIYGHEIHYIRHNHA